MHDHILRLDRYLGAFLDSLFRIRNQRDVVIALTADHGVTPYPEVHAHDPNSGAVRVDVQPVLQRLSNSLAARGVPSPGAASVGTMGGNGFVFEDGVLMLDHAALARAKINEDSLLRALKADFLRIPGVARADRISELAKADTVKDNVARRWLHMYADDSKVSMVVSLAPYNYWVSTFNMAWHGSPNDPDAHVPILFYGNRIRPGRYPEFARVVDMAPTLAAVLRVKPQEKLDGHVLQNAIR